MSKKLPSPNRPKRLSDGRYSCAYRWTDSTGRRRCATVYGTTRAEALAEARAAQVLAVSRAQRGDDQDRSRTAPVPTFSELVRRADVEWWPRSASPEHQATQRKRLDRWWVPVVGPRLVTSITPGDVAGILSRARSAGLSPATCNRILSAGGVVLQFAVELRLIAANPARQGGALRQREPKRAKRVLTAAQLRALVEACEPRWQPLVGLMAYAGLRHGEAVALLGADVDLERGELYIRRSGEGKDTTKGKRDRTVPIAPELHAILARLDLSPERRVSRLRDTRAAFDRAATAIGLDLHVHNHLLRHSFASALGRAGRGAAVIQRLLGHADLSTTQEYMHVTPAHADVDIFATEADDD